ncbi:SMP-30/gluconolactonase/LRE family protein [Rubellimicrobium rubrum]|uniref:SMP-30/gluconolactonase/LRE family protein n=1 Tax=Rubellimicrobium rubrum TaxID=2585369 RepID=A0A5C4MUG5_9RHOB|nr:SMP-30/gluconolactonase/LRE family protein [Rubellimicrobium rubrum]TNC48291.1 SMP-30/gluconolactonase/LRE family protein [Rubellimicrobium rubrum]
MTTARVHDQTVCLLGEGALWHPERGELLWFDILGRMLFAGERRHRLTELSSAAGWIDRDTILVAQKGALVRFHLDSGRSETVAGLDEANPAVRSNDGRADPWGGFWIGTMGLKAEPEAGAIWRYYRGEVRQLVPKVQIPNAICFDPSGTHVVYTDTETQIVWCQRLAEADGFPTGEREMFLDFRGTDLNPDGAVFDAEGNVWIAFWGSGKVAGYGRDGQPLEEFAVPAKQSTCPAFGGEGMSTLFVTTAAAGIPQSDLAAMPEIGRTFAIETGHKGIPEPKVIL